MQNNDDIKVKLSINLMRTNLPKEVQDFKCKDFWQPMLEAITNSLQAKATNIKIDFELDLQTSDSDIPVPNKIDGFSITDNGEGFVCRNRQRFAELKSANKTKEEEQSKKGCKGLGRLSYLKIFQEVSYISKTNNETIEFKFNESFSENSYVIKEGTNINMQTIAIFSKLTAKIKDNKSIDKREDYISKNIKGYIMDHLLYLLYFKKKSGIEFIININDNETIDKSDIPDLQEYLSNDNLYSFKLVGGTKENKEEAIFTLLYNISDINLTAGILHDYYCANELVVCRFLDCFVKINKIPNKNITFLLVSDFFDKGGVTNKEKTSFNIMPVQISLDIPFNWQEINSNLKQCIISILNKEIKGFNKDQKNKKANILQKRPYLAKYILANDSIGVLDEDKEIREAQKQFNSDRNECLDLIDNKEVLTEKQREKIKDTVSLQLSEYMQLRYSILQELENLIKNKESNEALIHNMILPKGKELNDDTLLIENLHHNNLWIIDDRFMSYKYAFSDKKINKIKETIKDNSETLADGKEPDFAVIFDNILTDSHDYRGVAIELKPFSFNSDDNEKGISQLVNYRRAFFKSDKLKEKWYYLITNVDARFADYLSGDGGLGYEKILSTGGDIFLDTKNRTYVMPIETLIAECKRRHELFFEIIQEEAKLMLDEAIKTDN